MSDFPLVTVETHFPAVWETKRSVKWTCPLTDTDVERETALLAGGKFMRWIFDLAPDPLKKWYCHSAYLFRYIMYTFGGVFVNRSFVLQNSFLALQQLLTLLNTFITDFLQIPVQFPIHLVGWLNFEIMQGLISSVYILAIPFISLLVGRKIYVKIFRPFI